MASLTTKPYFLTQKLFILFLLSLSVFLLAISNLSQKSRLIPLHRHQNKSCLASTASKIQTQLLNTNGKGSKSKKIIKVGLVNMNNDDAYIYKSFEGLVETTLVHFDRVPEERDWEEFFPEWIDEEEKYSKPSCPEIPMPKFEVYGDVDVVVARVPCGKNMDEKKGIRDVYRLQVNLVVANLLVRSGWSRNFDPDRMVYAVFIGSCGPMVELFRCDDLVSHEGDYWIFKPDLKRLRQKVLMPVGTCELAPPYATPGREMWRRRHKAQETLWKTDNSYRPPREAYVTVLHSSEAYVCGAIALAQSILQTKTTKELVLLADESIGTHSIKGLKAAGWKIKRIQRIKSPHAPKGSYNEWNYSKLRVWQLTEYDKVIFIDSDFIVLENIDHFFVYPQLSAAENNRVLFNSGIMVIEPSTCMFENLIAKTTKIYSYNGGDQGFLNEVFTWWHRWPRRMNYLKQFDDEKDLKHEIRKDISTIHYLGTKPWVCFKDYDCNWDAPNPYLHQFASDSANSRWWQVYELMPKMLQSYCALNERMLKRLKKWRGQAKNASFPDEHWKIEVKDPRLFQLV
ncbi:Glycosyl transferase, family 8 [Dillenia turbinata]|uniref:Hexosyltransferase n=1 Tax=Dillenia turbinata TaxID=194707 RepID=A0AAN8YSZ3_9MAGN